MMMDSCPALPEQRPCTTAQADRHLCQAGLEASEPEACSNYPDPFYGDGQDKRA